MHIESSNAYEIPLIETRGKDRRTRRYKEDSIFGRRNKEEEERSREKNNEFDYVSNAE